MRFNNLKLSIKQESFETRGLTYKSGNTMLQKLTVAILFIGAILAVVECVADCRSRNALFIVAFKVYPLPARNRWKNKIFPVKYRLRAHFQTFKMQYKDFPV